PIATWRQTHFNTSANAGNAADNADPDHDGLLNIFEYAFNLDPNASNAPPVSFTVDAGHLTLNFKRAHPAPADLTYLYEVADDLTAAPWQSGPTFTSESITDNLDGTETVRVTDNQAIGAAAGHYLRLRISRH